MARRTWPGRSEFSGETRTNTIAKKAATDDLSAEEQMRLMKLTGTENVLAQPDGHRSWNGWDVTPNSVIDFDD